MKISKILMAASLSLFASVANSTTVFEATDGDINIALTTTGGTPFAIFDNEADLNAATLSTDGLTITAGDLINVIAPPPAATTALDNAGVILSITDSNFVFGAFHANAWILGDGTELYNTGSNLWNITFAGINPEIKIAVDITAVPVPAAVWLFGSGLIGLVGIARRRV